MRSYILTIGCAMLIAIGAMGCGDSPVNPPAPGGGTNPGPGFTDVPDIPTPKTPGGDVPATSETLTVLKRHTSLYNPSVTNAYGSWYIDRVQLFGPGFPEMRTNVMDSDAWGSQVTDLYAKLFIQEEMSRIILQDENGNVGGPRISGDYGVSVLSRALLSEVDFRGSAVEKAVYIRRDRHWELKPLEGGAGNYLLLDGPVSGEVSSSYTKGVSNTQTEEFGRSVTASAGLSLGVLSLSVSGTLSETFSSSVTVSESKTETFTKTVTGASGKIVQFMVWELIEKYSFCDEDGNLYSDPHYVIPAASIVRRASAVYLQATEFKK
jgi:hypothetical protein